MITKAQSVIDGKRGKNMFEKSEVFQPITKVEKRQNQNNAVELNFVTK